MKAHTTKTVADLQVKLKEQEAEVFKTKQLINMLYENEGEPLLYADADLSPGSSITQIKEDQFYMQPLITSMRQILELRKSHNKGPASPKEIYDALIRGGYKFNTDIEENRITGVRVSLRKGSTIFHKLPNSGKYGLMDWYPKAKDQKSDSSKNRDENGTEDDVTDQNSNNTGEDL